MINRDRLTGIADEGAPSIDGQVEIHRRIGWDSIELRTVDGLNICEMDDCEFDRVAETVEKAGMRTVAFGSSIANWSRSITDPFEEDRDDLLRAIPRMRRLGCTFIRVMSYINRDDTLGDSEWAEESVNRLKELTRIASGEGVVLVLENCDGWASASPENFVRMMDSIPDASLQVVFDPGNPLSHGMDADSVFGFFDAAAGRIAHFHIKDCYQRSDGSVEHCFPGEGQCAVARLMERLERSGYKGMYSIEPHMTVQIHKSMETDTGLQAENYRRYADRAIGLAAAIRG